MAKGWEQLEARTLLSGVVQVNQTADFLTVRGDAASNQIVLQRLSGETALADAPGRFALVGVGDTNLDGAGPDNHLVFSGVRRLSIDLGDGNDGLELDHLRVRGPVDISGGGGNDRITLRGTYGSAVSVDAGGGDDRITISRFESGSLLVAGGAGRDRVYCDRTLVRGAAKVEDSSKSFVFSADQFRVRRGNFSLRSGNSADHVTLTRSVFHRGAEIATTGGDDQFTVRETHFHGAAGAPGGAGAAVDLGTGHNAQDREIILGWNFNDGRQGWAPGFSDYHFTAAPGATDTDPLAGYDVRTEIAPLPAPLDAGGAGGFEMSSANSSDDLFMFLSKRLGPAEGVQPSADYRIEISARFATDAPFGAGGVGGSPGANVTVKVGAIGREPRAAADAGGVFRLNADIGAQSSSGSDLSVAGDVANGLDSNDANGGLTWRLVRRDHIHPNAVRASATGELWPIVGTDSGFEGITTLYYSSIVVRLTPA